MATSNKRICSSCKVNKCNSNFKWCQDCYTKSKIGYTYSQCRKCAKPPNPGFDLCENCFQSGVGISAGEKICIMCNQIFYETDKDLCKSCIAKLESGDKSPLAGTPSMCKDCKKNPANPGFSRCEHCYRQTLSSPFNGLPPSMQYGTTYGQTVPAISPMCKDCNKTPANLGYSQCEHCYRQTLSSPFNGLPSSMQYGTTHGQTVPAISPMCKDCKKNPVNPGFSRCEYCYRQTLSSPYNGLPSSMQYGTSYNSTVQQFPHHQNPIASPFRFINPRDTRGQIFNNSPQAKPRTEDKSISSLLEKVSTVVRKEKKKDKPQTDREEDAHHCVCPHCYSDSTQLDLYYCIHCFEKVILQNDGCCDDCRIKIKK